MFMNINYTYPYTNSQIDSLNQSWNKYIYIYLYADKIIRFLRIIIIIIIKKREKVGERMRRNIKNLTNRIDN